MGWLLGPRAKEALDRLMSEREGATRRRRAAAVAPALSPSFPLKQWQVYLRDGKVRCRGGARFVVMAGADFVSDHEVGAVPSQTSCVVMRYDHPTVDEVGNIQAGAWLDGQATLVAGSASEQSDTATRRTVVIAEIAVNGDDLGVTQYWEGPIWVLPLLNRAALYE